jgi:hypothetical protein
MRHSSHAHSLRLAGWFAAVVLPFLVAAEAPAQSGRRAPSNVPVPDSTNLRMPEPDGKSRIGPELSRKLTILVAREPTTKHFVAEDAIYASFINRLSQYSTIKASSIGDLKRGGAKKRARVESEAFVVLVHFGIDSFQEGTILLNSQDLIVEYSVFAPTTGKQQSKGKVYFQQVGGGRLRKSEWPTGTPIKITTEATGIEAAEQLYAWLLLKIGVKGR